MKKEFDWDKFRTENIAVHCKTQREADEFFKKMNLKGTPDTERNNNCWNDHKKDTCFDLDKNDYWTFSDKEWYKYNGYTVLEFSDYFDIDEPNSHYSEIKFNGDCFIIKEREECSNAEWMYLCDLFNLDYEAIEQIVIDGIVKYFGLRKDEV